MRARRLLCLVAASALLAVLVPLSTAVADPASPGHGIPNELSPSEDNAQDSSKAACQDVTSSAGSVVIRRLVDGPRQADGSVAFVSGVCIYLPPGYDSGDLRYPVLYLLHGGFGQQEDWVVQGDAQRIFDDAFAQNPADAMIVVMPDADTGGWWKDDRSGFPLNETYVVDHLVEYVDTYLRTIPTRDGRAVAGLSNGGAGAARLAAKHPDVFGVLAAMSGAFPLATGTPHDVRSMADDPTHIADNLDDTPVALIWGSECGDDTETCRQYAFQWGFEQGCCQQALFVDALDHSERNVPYVYEETVGGHDWVYWQAWLADHHGPFLHEHLLDPQPVTDPVPVNRVPHGFDHRSIEPSFDVYGWSVTADPERAPEFLRLTSVTTDSITLTGSGQTTVTTPPSFVPGADYVVGHLSDGPPSTVRADDAGRLTFVVDLGAAHAVAELTAAQRALDSAGYFTTRAVTISPAAGGSVDGQGTIEHVYLLGEQYHYFLYTPAGYDPSVATPMQVVIHGANTVAHEQLIANEHHSAADRENFLVLYPDFVNTAERHPNSNESDQASGIGTHPIRLWDSMDVTSRARGQGDAAAIAAMVEQVMQRRNVDADRVYVSGMSSGAMMTSLMMGLYPDVFAAGGIVAGCGFASIGSCPLTDPTAVRALARSAHAAMGLHARPVPFIELHGQRDTTVQPAWGAAAVRQWLTTANLAASGGVGEDGVYGLSPSSQRHGATPGGHTWTVDSYTDDSGCLFAEHWRIHEMNHFWPGGTTHPDYQNFTDPRGPNGAEATWAFFEQFDRSGNRDC